MKSISKLESFGYNTFWIVGGGQGFSKAFRSEKCTKSSYFDKMSKMGLLWRISCSLMKGTDIFSIYTFEIDPFTNKIETCFVFYDKVDILGHFVPLVNLVLSNFPS